MRDTIQHIRIHTLMSLHSAVSTKLPVAILHPDIRKEITEINSSVDTVYYMNVSYSFYIYVYKGESKEYPYTRITVEY